MRLVRAPIWHCASDALTCRNGHPRYRDGLTWRGAGLVLLACDTCHPATYAVGVQVYEPDDLVTFYDVTAEEMRLADRLWREKVKLVEILARLGYCQREVA